MDDGADRLTRLRRRLDWLKQPGKEADEAAVLDLAITQAMGAVGALNPYGGMAHLAGQGGALHLAAVSLPPDIAAVWEPLDRSADEAPAQAVALHTVIWSRKWPSTPTGPTTSPIGVLSAPLTGPDGTTPIGALSVFVDTPPSSSDADDADRQNLRALADEASAQLAEARRWRSGAKPWWRRRDAGPAQRLMTVVEGVGRWSWDLETGLLDYDEVTEGLLRQSGVDLTTWGNRIEKWMERIHPDDLPGVNAAIEESRETGDLYAVKYRVMGPDGTYIWLELRALFEYENSRAVRMAGTAWNVSEASDQAAWVGALLGDYPDPIYILDSSDCVEYANGAGRAMAERAGIAATGEVPWEALPQLSGQGLPEMVARVRLTAKASETTTVRIDQADGEAWYWVRAVETSGWVSLQWVDVTQQTRKEHADAERDRALEALNNALRTALDTRQVVSAIVTYALPLIGADGVVAHDLTGPEPRLIGLTGHGTEFMARLNQLDWSQRLEATALAEGPQYIESVGDLGDRWPQLLPLADSGGKKAWAAIPLTVSAEVVGSRGLHLAPPAPLRAQGPVRTGHRRRRSRIRPALRRGVRAGPPARRPPGARAPAGTAPHAARHPHGRPLQHRRRNRHRRPMARRDPAARRQDPGRGGRRRRRPPR